MSRIPCIWVGLVIAGFLGGGCGGRGVPEGRDASPDTDHSPPLVGGPCTYDHLLFRATVDSVLSDGALLVRPDTTLTTGRRCDRVQEAGAGQWLVPGPPRRPAPTPGDRVEVAADVIVMGTCVPCTAHTRVLDGGR